MKGLTTVCAMLASASHACPRTVAALICFLFGALSCCTSQAAELNAASNQLPIRLGLYLEMLVDETGTLDVDDVRRASQTDDWQRSAQAVPTLGFSASTYWFRFTLSGSALAESDLVLDAHSPTLDRVDLFVFNQGRLLKQSSAGDTIPFSELEIAHSIPLFSLADLADPSQQLELFIRVKSQGGLEIPLTLTSLSLELQDQQSETLFYGLFLACFLIGLALCSVFLVILRDRQFFGYTLFFASVSVFFLAMSGLGRGLFWPEATELNTRLSYVGGAAMLASFCLLGQSINLTHRHRDRAVIVLRFICWLMLPASLYFILTPYDQISTSSVRLVLFLGLLVAVTVFIMTGFAAKQGSRLAMYSFITWLLIILALFTLLGYKSALVEKTTAVTLIGQIFLMYSAVMLMVELAEFIRSKNKEFAQAQLETKAKGDFLKNVSREFLTPVHLILSNSKRLMAAHSSKLDETTHQHVSTVIKQSDHLHSLINDLLEMAEIESDSFEPEFELVEMSQFLSELRDIMLPSVLEKDLECKTDFAAANLLVQTDRARLQHALINIITNAIKFTDEGSITIGYKAVYFRSHLGMELFVKDTGRGISDEFKERLFQEFARDDDYSEKDPSNTGLGMVIVKRLIEKLGGEVDCESKPGEGSTFFIRLPLRIGKA
jgi:signal transduction histidine kinase